MRDGKVVDVDVWQVFFNNAFWYEAIHMLLAAYVVAGFTVAGVYAAGMLRGRRDRYHRIGLLIPLTVGAIAIPLQIVMGDFIARYVFQSEPAKFAAIEALPHTRTHAPETLGGVLIDGKVRFGIPIPSGASLLSGFSPSTKVSGLDAIPRRSARPTSSCRSCTCPSTSWSARLRAARARAVVRPVVVAQPASRPEPLVPARHRRQRRRRDRVAGMRLDRHRGRPPAVDGGRACC